MPTFIGYYRDKNGKIVSVNEVAFHQDAAEEFVLVRSNTGVVRYPNKKLATCDLPRVIAAPRAVFDNQYTFMGEDWHPPGFMEGCVFS